MKLPIWLSLLALGVGALFGQSAAEGPGALYWRRRRASYLRANTSLELTAKAGDILFPCDSLRSGDSILSFIDCPENYSLTLSRDGVVTLEARHVRVKSGRITTRTAVGSCLMPTTVRVALASQQHYGLSLTRPLQAGPNGAATFAERVANLPPAKRSAMSGELAPIDRALAANEHDQVARISRAALFEKYDFRPDAAIEYMKVLQEWPDAVWIFNRLFALEDQPAPERLPAEPAAAKGNTYALLVGISKYRSERITPLLYPARGARDRVAERAQRVLTRGARSSRTPTSAPPEFAGCTL